MLTLHTHASGALGVLEAMHSDNDFGPLLMAVKTVVDKYPAGTCPSPEVPGGPHDLHLGF